ncbi:MAG: Gfo/Idh/MocA family oxidoreductase [Bacteroidota bacterium]|nr:Gfo/Idh/MocA family oxidoreductase [Bacteroidota bacterium]
MKGSSPSRRHFLQQVSGTALALAASQSSLAFADQWQNRVDSYSRKISPNDKIRIGVIGIGIQGNNDLNAALKVPGTEVVAACDLYRGRLERARELHGKDLFVTADYRELLLRKDVDAVIIATSDHWHSRITIDALERGKAVYCEKPMVHKISQGPAVLEAWRKSKKTMQVGSQRVSSISTIKAREAFRSGAIGQLSTIEANFDRQSALGAWEYTMPTDGSPETVDWKRYIQGMPDEPYDPKKFFWWRNYQAFGTGVAGDLFIHLLSGIHAITDSKGPEKIYSSAQLAYWKDGRDVPDVMAGVMQYPETKEHPEFQLMLRVNFISGNNESGGMKLIGSEGVLEWSDNGFTIRHHKMSKAPGIGGWDALATYPKEMQETLMTQYNQKYSAAEQLDQTDPDTVFQVPVNYDDHVEHFGHFFEGVRNGTPVVEDPVFGFRAAAPCLAANESYFQNKIIRWDPVNMKLIS